MTGEQLAIIASALGVVGVVLGALVRFVIQPLWRLTIKTGHFLDSWNGEPARDGLPARPGVVDRIVAIEYQLHPNGGGSMKDAVDRIEAKVDEQAATAAEVKTALEAEQASVRNDLAAHRQSTTAELKEVWRSLAARDIHRSAEHLSVVADRAERVAERTTPQEGNQ
jgi:hypothetical protein